MEKYRTLSSLFKKKKNKSLILLKGKPHNLPLERYLKMKAH